MDETLGTLRFKFQAEVDSWRQSLAELDRMQAEYRRKWEAPVRMMAGGGGGSDGGVSTPRGPNVTGTSNGDVTWRLEEAVRRSQSYADGAGGGGGRGGGYRSHRAREQFFMSDSERIANDAMPWGASSRINPYTGDRMGSTEVAVKPDQEGAQKPWWRKNIGHTAIRTFVGTLIVDAIASELNNEENYKKAFRLAGNDQGAQATAVLERTKGAFGAIPYVGGIAYNLANGIIGAAGGPSAQSIETSLALSAQQNAYQASDTQIRLGAISQQYGSQAMLAGKTFRGRELQSKVSKIGRDAALRMLHDEMESKAGMEGYASDWSDLASNETSGKSWIPFIGAMYRNDDVDSANDARRNRNDDRRRTMSKTLDVARAANKASDAAEAQERKYEATYTIDQQQAQIVTGALNNQYRYVAGAAAGVVGGYRASVADARRRGMNDDDASILYNQGTIARQGLEQQRRDALENYRWGSGREYNPTVESPLAYTDRNPETLNDQIGALATAIQELSTVMKQNFGGGQN